MLNLRLATPADTSTAAKIVEDGRIYLASQGLPQWQDGYGPDCNVIESDAANSNGYILELDGKVCGYSALITDVNLAYDNLGTWEGSSPHYISITRVALNPNVRGRGLCASLLSLLIDEARRLGCTDIRIDTHPGNVIMQKAIIRAGFTLRGNIKLDIPNGERIAYQLLI